MPEIRDIKFRDSEHILTSVQVMISVFNIFLVPRNFAWNHSTHSMASGFLRTAIILFAIPRLATEIAITSKNRVKGCFKEWRERSHATSTTAATRMSEICIFNSALFRSRSRPVWATWNDFFCNCACQRREQQTTAFLVISKSRTLFQFQDSWSASFHGIIEKLLQNAQVSLSDIDVTAIGRQSVHIS